jgi:hypothetical protein
MMRRYVLNRVGGNARFLLVFRAMAVLAALLSCGIAVGQSMLPIVVEPQWQPQTDAQGTQWTVDQQADVQINNGPTMLTQAGVMTINGQQFAPQRVQMSPDGREYVFEGVTGNGNMAANPYSPYAAPMPSYGYAIAVPNGGGTVVQATRRVKVDVATSTVRFVESFQNPSAAAIQLNVSVTSGMRTQLRTAIGGPSGKSFDAATGQPLASGGAAASAPAAVTMPFRRSSRGAGVRLELPKHDCGVAVSAGAGNLPGTFFYLPGSRALKPAIDIQGQRVVRASFNLNLPAQSTVSIVWGLAQMKTAKQPDERQLKEQLKLFQDGRWLAGLPEGVIKSIINLRQALADGSMGPLLQPVFDQAARFNVNRGKDDVVVQDEHLRLTGVVSGGGITVATAQGKVTLPLEDVALLSGGGGVDRPMRVYLRNGEILLGRIEAKDLELKTADGGDARLPPERINMLFLHAAANDGKPPAEAVAMLMTHDGQRWLVGGDARLNAVSPWGALEVGLDEIASLASRSEPQPLYQMGLRDGSKLSVVLDGDAPAVKSLRFGPVQLASVGLRQLWSLKMPAPPKADDDDEPAMMAGPHCRLIGETVLVGTLDTPQLTVSTAGGVVSVPASGIQSAQRSSEAALGEPLQIELIDGHRIAGTLTNHTVSIRFHGKAWEIPAQHVVGIAGHAKEITAGKLPGQKVRAHGELASKELRELPLPPGAGDGDPFGLPPALQPAAPPGVPVPTLPPDEGGDDPFGAVPTAPRFYPAAPAPPELTLPQVLPSMPEPVAPPTGTAPAAAPPVEEPVVPSPSVTAPSDGLPLPLPPTAAPVETTPPSAPPVSNPSLR